MKRLDIRKYLFDINEACELLVRFTTGKTFSDYSADPILRSAVERQFEIIGEALAQLLRLDPSCYGTVEGPRTMDPIAREPKKIWGRSPL